MYGVAGERRLTEFELPGSAATRARGRSASGTARPSQRQLDVYGEVVDALYKSRTQGLAASDGAWRLTRKIFDWLEPAGASRTRASGRCAGRAGTSRTRR